MNKYKFIVTLVIIIIKIYSIQSKDSEYIIKKLKYHNDKVLCIAFSPNGEYLLSGSEDKTIKLYHIPTDKIILDIEAHYAGVKDVDFFMEGRKIITAGDKSIKIWNFEGIKEKTFLGHYTYIWSFDVSNNNKYLVSASYEDYFRVWDIQNEKLIKTVKGHEKSTLAVCINPDNKYIASGSLDKTIKLWDLETLDLIYTFEGHADNIYCVKFSNNAKYLVSASTDKNLKLWDVENKSFIINYMGHENSVLSCDFSPDDKHIISCSADMNIKLWETKTAECVYTYIYHDNIVNDVCFSPDGKSFASASDDYSIVIWEINPEIFVYFKYSEEFYEELDHSGLWGSKKSDETREEFKIREEKAAEFKKTLIEKYYDIYINDLN